MLCDGSIFEYWQFYLYLCHAMGRVGFAAVTGLNGFYGKARKGKIPNTVFQFTYVGTSNSTGRPFVI